MNELVSTPAQRESKRRNGKDKEIANSLLNAGITLDQAKLITKALAKGLVPHVVVNY
jgi:CRISPR/Cas system-associated endonuclease Cas1